MCPAKLPLSPGIANSEGPHAMSDPMHPETPADPNDAGSASQQVQYRSVTARVLESVRGGVFANGVMILQSAHEFAIDFLSTLGQPPQLVARLILPAANFAQFVAALQENYGHYQQHFGHGGGMRGARPGEPPFDRPPPPGAAAPVEVGAAARPDGPSPAGQSDPRGPARPPQPNIEELYEQLRFSDETLAGAFANAAKIEHSADEFCFDFVVNLYPRSIVVRRVFIAASRVPAILDALQGALRRGRPGS